MKDIDPSSKKKTFLTRLGVMVVLLGVLLGASFHAYRMSKQTKKEPQKVLGAQDIQKQALNFKPEVPDTIQKSFIETKDIALDIAHDELSKISSQAASTVSTYVVEHTLSPLIDKVKSLPPDQQQTIKDALCNP